MLEINKIYQGDCLEIMKQIDDKSIDLLITDPPYFMKLDYFKTRKRFQQTFSDLNVIEHFFTDVFVQIERVMKQTGRIYMFCDGQSYPMFWIYMFRFCKNVRPLIWDKKTSINGYSWRHQHELVIFAEMPETKPVPSGDGDILRLNAVKVDERTHPAEKPTELLKQFVLKSSKKGDLILDCFAGTGSTLITCKELKRDFIGIEIDENYCKIANKKIQELLKEVQGEKE